MFDQESAEKIVVEFINGNYHVEGDELVIVPDETIEKDYGWIFFYNSKRYLRTGEFGDRLAGNGPVVFEKNSGSVHQLGTYRSPLELIQEFENKRDR